MMRPRRMLGLPHSASRTQRHNSHRNTRGVSLLGLVGPAMAASTTLP